MTPDSGRNWVGQILDWMAAELDAAVSVAQMDALHRALVTDLETGSDAQHLHAGIELYVTEHRHRNVPPTVAEIRSHARRIADDARQDSDTQTAREGLASARAALLKRPTQE